MEHIPLFVSATFMLAAFLAVFLFLKSNSFHRISFFILAAWLMLQAILSLNYFYSDTSIVPPRFPLLIFPPMLVIGILFLTKKGRIFIDCFDLKTLTLLHVVRIPVEFVLLWLSIYKVVPQLMTFEGRNFDILSGLTAPLIYYFGFVRKIMNKKMVLAWNFICLGLLINIVVNAVFSVPFAFQKFGFEQPNIAVLYFPFVWLPCCIVPLVLLSHLIVIRKLILSSSIK